MNPLSSSPSSSSSSEVPGLHRSPSFQSFELPEGEIASQDINSIVELVSAGARDITYPLIFAKLAGKQRIVTGEVLRPFFQELLSKADVTTPGSQPPPDVAVPNSSHEALDVLGKLASQIVDIRTGVDFLEMNFNFGPGVKEATLKVPGSFNWVLEQKYKTDPYLVNPGNTPKFLSSEPRVLVIKNQVRFSMSPQGIAGIREGDIQVKVMIKWNAGIRTELKPNTVEYDSMDRPYIEMADGKPVIVNDHYVPRRLNNWLVVTVLKKDIWIGLPDLF